MKQNAGGTLYICILKNETNNDNFMYVLLKLGIVFDRFILTPRIGHFSEFSNGFLELLRKIQNKKGISG